jgi:hypothetical protein
MAGADIDFVNSWNDIPLNCACTHKDIVACIKPLVMRGTRLNHRNIWGDTPLLCATIRNNLEIGSFLLDRDADMYISDNRGETPLFRAIFCGNHILWQGYPEVPPLCPQPGQYLFNRVSPSSPGVLPGAVWPGTAVVAIAAIAANVDRMASEQ